MKYFKIIIAAALALSLTACSFFYKNETENINTEVADGEYSCEVSLSGGSGKASVASPATVIVEGNKKTVQLVWSSSHYDYMLVEDQKYENEGKEGENSTFTIPFEKFDEAFQVIGDTTAMSTPHEIEYELTVFAPGESASDATPSTETGKDNSSNRSSEDETTESGSVRLGNLTYESSLELDYANNFSVDYYKSDKGDEYAFITITGVSSNQYFLRPLDGADASVKGLSDNVTVLGQIHKTYLVSTSVMDLIVNIDGLSDIAFSGSDAKDWYIEEAVSAIDDGEILYGGKYSAPDYELLVSKGCNFAIENTMIYHNPEVKEKLESLGIPVLVETSGYEGSPLGRLEWIKLYGVLYGHLDAATEVFENQVSRTKNVLDVEATDKSVAFFSINSNGQITVRKNGDYISSMIAMAGGNYVPGDISAGDDALSTVKISMEDFYVGAVDADVLIYNSTIEGEVSSIEDLTKSMPSLKDFQTVKDKNVYCLREGYFQKTTKVAEFIEELHLILTDSFETGECFYKLKE